MLSLLRFPLLDFATKTKIKNKKINAKDFNLNLHNKSVGGGPHLGVTAVCMCVCGRVGCLCFVCVHVCMHACCRSVQHTNSIAL